jgi:hypothetical protein
MLQKKFQQKVSQIKYIVSNNHKQKGNHTITLQESYQET